MRARRARRRLLGVRDTDPIVSVAGLEKRYGPAVAVADVSFAVAAGEVFGLIGPNGSGKTTTVECVQGLRRPDRGELRVLGLDPAVQGDEVRRRIGCQLQEAALPDRIRVWEALDLFASASSRAGDWRSLLREWGLEEKRDASFASLSGGQRQRLFVALALVNRPEVVFLDEMTTGLDPGARRVAWELIEAIRDQGATVILVTHFMEEAARLCDRVAVLRAGRVVALDTPDRLAAAHGGGTRITFTASGIELDWIERVPGVVRVDRHSVRVRIEGSATVLPLVAAGLVERGFVPGDLHVEQPTLEDAFLALVGTVEE
jgi:ABC-2 type transport system ATP-binding protein